MHNDSKSEKTVVLTKDFNLTVAVPEIWDILEMVEKNARTFLKFQLLF